MISGVLEFRGDSVLMVGVDFGGAGKVLAKTDTHVAVKWPGHYFWASMMTPKKWASPMVIVYERQKTAKGCHCPAELDDNRWAAKPVIEWKLGKGK